MFVLKKDTPYKRKGLILPKINIKFLFVPPPQYQIRKFISRSFYFFSFLKTKQMIFNFL